MNKEYYESLSRQELIEMWVKVFGNPPTNGLTRSFLIKHLVYQEQVNNSSNLSASCQKLISKLISKYTEQKDIKDKDIKNSTGFYIKAGTKLIREFRGEKHEVIALEKGFEYKGKIYKSLSAIASSIAGTRWNGKVFFGVAR